MTILIDETCLLFVNHVTPGINPGAKEHEE